MKRGEPRSIRVGTNCGGYPLIEDFHFIEAAHRGSDPTIDRRSLRRVAYLDLCVPCSLIQKSKGLPGGGCCECQILRDVRRELLACVLVTIANFLKGHNAVCPGFGVNLNLLAPV